MKEERWLSIDGVKNWQISTNNNITQDDVEQLNAVTEKTVFVVRNTKNLDPSVLRQIDNPNVIISVMGGFDYLEKKKRRENGVIRRTLYDTKTLAHIVTELENLESAMNPDYTEKEKAFWVFFTLANRFKYTDRLDMDGETPHDTNLRSLEIILNNEGVCAGFAQLYKECMDRLDIDCELQGLASAHDWNIITLDNKKYLMDLSDASCYSKQKNIPACLHCFGAISYDKHHNVSKDKEETPYNLETFSNSQLAELLNSVTSKIDSKKQANVMTRTM